MTDTSGVDDSDTASGGLQNDMPGIGNAPPSPRMVPQGGLSGLAQYARQALGIGAPAPRAPPPGRSPWQAPGQSQISVGQNQPSPGDARWTGTTASFAVPKGSPQPQAKFNRFMGTIPGGNWRQWGQPEPYGDQPQPFEAPGIAQGLSKFFSTPGQGGSAFSVPLALGMGKYADLYMKSFQQGQQVRAQMMKQKWLEYSMELQYQQEQRHTSIADIIARYTTEAGSNDPAKLLGFKLKGKSVYDALHDNALQTNDTDIAGMVEDGVPLDKIMRYQDYRDSRLKDLQKTNKALTEQEEEDKGWKEEQGRGGDQQQPQPSPNSPFLAPGDQPRAQPSAPAGGSAAPSMVAQGGGSPFLAPDQPSPDAMEVQAQPGDDPDDVAATTFMRGGPADALPKGEERGRILAKANKRQGMLDALAGRIKGGSMTEDQAMDELRKINPVVAADWQRILHGAPIPGGWSQVGSRPYWQDFQDIAVAVKPGWLPQDADAIKKFTESYSSQPMTNMYTRSSRMGSAGVNLLEATKRAVKDGTLTDNAFVNKWNQFKNNQLSDNDDSWGIFNSAQTYVMDALAVANGGKPYQGDIRQYMDKQFYMTGPRAIYRIIQQDAVTALGVVEPLEEDFVTQRERHSPHYNKERFDLLRGLTHLDPRTGGFGGADVPSQLKALEGDENAGGVGGKVHSWKDYFQ